MLRQAHARLRRRLVLVVVLAIAGALLPATTGQAAAQPELPGAEAIPVRLNPTPPPSRTHIPVERTANGGSCAEQVKQIEASPQVGSKVTSCFEVTTRPAPEQRTAARSVWCEGVDPGWWVTRREACQVLYGYMIVYDMFNPSNVLGEAWMTIRQEIEANDDPATPYWDEYVSLTLDDGWGAATTLQSEITEQCPSPCRMSNTSAWGGRRGISVGQTLEGDFDNYWIPTGSVNRMTMTYRISHIVPGAANTPDGSWTSPVLRCDHDPGLGTFNAGCVWPDHWPQLRLPVSQYREGAMTVAVGNYYLQDGFGYLQPLTRLANDVEAGWNRDVICDGTFYPIFPDDTCDEYAFASSYQSGRMLGVGSGIECAEVYFQEVGGQWYIYPVRTVYGFERCVRAHVPGQQNSAVGGAYSGLIRNERLLNGDPFYAYAV